VTTSEYLRLRGRVSLDQAWQAYRATCLGPVIDERDVELAFKAGAVVLFRAILTSLDPDSEPTARDIRFMQQVTAELDRFDETFDEAIRQRRGARQ
jgi:hypothetical protein